jgi:hypothetical protein
LETRACLMGHDLRRVSQFADHSCYCFADLLAIVFRAFAQISETDQNVDVAASEGDREKSNPGALAALVAALALAVSHFARVALQHALV